MSKTRRCGTCKGTGTIKPAPSGNAWPFPQQVTPCTRCNGRGTRA